MPRTLRVAAGVSGVCALLVLAGCAAPSARAEQAAATTTVWRSLGSWSGDGSRQTESFDVTTGALRLRWEARATDGPEHARLRVWLYSAISGRPLQQIVDQAGPGAGTAHVADDPRTSYLVIEADRVAWSAALDEGFR